MMACAYPYQSDYALTWTAADSACGRRSYPSEIASERLSPASERALEKVESTWCIQTWRRVFGRQHHPSALPQRGQIRASAAAVVAEAAVSHAAAVVGAAVVAVEAVGVVVETAAVAVVVGTAEAALA